MERKLTLEELSEFYPYLPNDPLYKKFEEQGELSPSLEVAKSIVRQWTDPHGQNILELTTKKGGVNTDWVYGVGVGLLEAREGKPTALYYLSLFRHNHSNPHLSVSTLYQILEARIIFRDKT